MPYDSNDNADCYINCLAGLESIIINECASSLIYIVGDFDTDINRNSQFTYLLQNFVNETNFILSDQVLVRDGSLM